ncbi:MAG: hypothetical protein HQL61_07730 [Magnetococcales bacterium]|nr:hypothetical protein [Nitrospirota bacterium]
MTRATQTPNTANVQIAWALGMTEMEVIESEITLCIDGVLAIGDLSQEAQMVGFQMNYIGYCPEI